MKRMALKLKARQVVILPSGRKAKVLEIGYDMVVFQYLDGLPEKFELSRAFCVRLWGVEK